MIVDVVIVDGKWGDWTNWTECSVTCGDGKKTRSRDCSPPTHGGKDCEGEPTETEDCKNDDCPG